MMPGSQKPPVISSNRASRRRRSEVSSLASGRLSMSPPRTARTSGFGTGWPLGVTQRPSGRRRAFGYSGCLCISVLLGLGEAGVAPLDGVALLVVIAADHRGVCGDAAEVGGPLLGGCGLRRGPALLGGGA